MDNKIRRKESEHGTIKNHFTKKAMEGRTRELQNRHKTMKKVVTISPDLSIMLLNVNVLNLPIEKCWMAWVD